jgi:vacuolar-type H+-ATPase subunit I/STV1
MSYGPRRNLRATHGNGVPTDIAILRENFSQSFAKIEAVPRGRTMNELIQKIEARIAARREELEGWENSSYQVSQILNSEIAFLEALLAEMKAMGQ